MSLSDPLEIAAFVAEAFERLGVRYILGGSLASAAMGEPRATLDIDLVADLAASTLGPWLAALGPEFLSITDGRARKSLGGVRSRSSTCRR